MTAKRRPTEEKAEKEAPDKGVFPIKFRSGFKSSGKGPPTPLEVIDNYIAWLDGLPKWPPSNEIWATEGQRKEREKLWLRFVAKAVWGFDHLHRIEAEAVPEMMTDGMCETTTIGDGSRKTALHNLSTCSYLCDRCVGYALKALRQMQLLAIAAKGTGRRRQRGRPRTGDPAQDRRLAEMLATKSFKSREELAREVGMTPLAVKKAIDRHRHWVKKHGEPRVPSLGNNPRQAPN